IASHPPLVNARPSGGRSAPLWRLRHCFVGIIGKPGKILSRMTVDFIGLKLYIEKEISGARPPRGLSAGPCRPGGSNSQRMEDGMMKKKLLALLLAGVMVLSLAACGGDDTTADTADDTTAGDASGEDSSG